MENQDEEIVQLLLFALNLYGIYPFTENVGVFRRNWMLVYSYIVYAVLAVGSLCLVILCEDIVSEIGGLIVIIGSVYYFMIQFLSARKSGNLRRLLTAFRSHDKQWLTFATNIKIKEKVSYNRMFCIHRWFAIYNIYSFLLIIIFPIFAVKFLNVSEIGKPSSLIYPSWYPWDMNDIRWYIVTYCIQIFSGILFQINMYTTTTFHCIVLSMFKNYFHELQHVIRSVKYTQNVVDDLRCCVRRHQLLLSMFNDYRSWFNVLYASELTYYTLEFLLLGSVAFANSPDIVSRARYTLFLLNITILLYIHCWIGESFYSLNGLLYEAVYSLPWYESNFMVAKKSILVFIDQTQYPLCLSAFDMFEASLQLFFGILKTSYGYLSLLLATLK